MKMISPRAIWSKSATKRPLAAATPTTLVATPEVRYTSSIQQSVLTDHKAWVLPIQINEFVQYTVKAGTEVRKAVFNTPLWPKVDGTNEWYFVEGQTAHLQRLRRLNPLSEVVVVDTADEAVKLLKGYLAGNPIAPPVNSARTAFDVEKGAKNPPSSTNTTTKPVIKIDIDDDDEVQAMNTTDD
jgi:hypothetical protein